jgi:hypothetical protein
VFCFFVSSLPLTTAAYLNYYGASFQYHRESSERKIGAALFGMGENGFSRAITLHHDRGVLIVFYYRKHPASSAPQHVAT